MSDSPVRFERSTPVLRSADYERSRRYYVDVLGFAVHEEGGDPARFGILDRDRAIVFIDAWHGGPQGESRGWNAYVHVSDVDALCGEFEARGAVIRRFVETTAYGMREFEVVDPDGNVLCFGQDAP